MKKIKKFKYVKIYFFRKLPTLVHEIEKINLEHAQEPDTPYTLVYGS